jgi:methyl-accepting chemotaxis protein
MGRRAGNIDSLDERLSFIGLDEDDRAVLKNIAPMVARAIGPALDVFYNKMRMTAETRRFFTDENHMSAAKGKQAQHWAKITSGAYDDNYWAGIRKIGETHARIGLEPRWYIGSYALIVEQLINEIVTAQSANLLRLRRGDPKAMARTLSSIVKAAMLDMEIAISVYLETLDEKRRQAESAGRQAVENERVIVTNSIGVGLRKLADKDLTFRLHEPMPDAYSALQANFNAAADLLAEAMTGVAGSANQINAGTRDISAASDDLARRTEQQAAGLEQTAAALGELVTTVKRSAEGAAHASRVVAHAKEDAEKSGIIVRKAVEAMTAIADSSQQISQIIGVIDEIAFQTNLLALNAGVEAARAGEVGRGFAVVASEVRALAQRSAEAAKEIKDLISKSSTQVAQGVELVGETGQALERIVGQVTEINNVVAQIAAGARDQATGLDEVNIAIGQMDQATQQNAAMVEEQTASVQSLSQETNQLASMVGQFQVGEALDADAGARRGAQLAARRHG